MEEQLQSLTVQSTPLTEVHMHDWGSTDGTRAITSAWAKKQRYKELLSVSKTPPSLVFSDVSLIDEKGCRLADSFYEKSLSPYKTQVVANSPDLPLVSPALGMSMCISRELAEILVTHRNAPWPMHDWAAAYRQHSDNLRGSPGISKLGPRLQRLTDRRRQVLALRRWAIEGSKPLPTKAKNFFPASRIACATRVLRSKNLRLWYRLTFALILMFSLNSKPKDRRSFD